MQTWRERAEHKRNIMLLTQEGSFTVGCNYWASHAGTAMWTDWRPEVVEADLDVNYVQKGYRLFSTHFVGLEPNGIIILYIFTLS